MKRQTLRREKSGRGKEYSDYRQRFEAVNTLAIEELRRLSPEDCLRQVHELRTLLKALNGQIHSPQEIDAVRQRWQKLKGFDGAKENA